ncbi:MAG: class I adenylate-forming enzyme family protein [Nocardioidaceae bacterium]
MSETPSSPADWLRANAADLPARVAVEAPGGTRLTYAELQQRADASARAFADAGVRRGDRVATVGRNSVDQVVVLFACARLGALMVPLSWRSAPGELAAVLADAGPALVLASDEHRPLAMRACGHLEDTPAVARLDDVGHATNGPCVQGEVRPALDDPLLLIYTSGSTGRPKGVPLSQRNCWATDTAIAARFPLGPDDVVLTVLPQFHVGAWNVQSLPAWRVGARVLLPPSFDAGEVLDLIERERITAMMGVATPYQMLCRHPAFATADLGSLRTLLCGGAPLEPAVREAWAARGHPLTLGYGLTEAGPNVLCEPPGGTGTGAGMVPYPGVRVALRDPATGDVVEGPGAGELLVSGGGVFTGYWRGDDPTARVIHGGWLATGDLAERGQDGTYRLTGRTSEMYISGGENVHPRQVERVLLEHPEVVAASVVGVPDATWGEAGVAFVVVRSGGRVTEQELTATCREHLAGYKVPRRIVLTDGLPLTGSGKVDKRALRAAAEERP